MLDVYSCQQLCIAAKSMDCSRNAANRLEVLNEDIVAISSIYSMLNKLMQKLFVHACCSLNTGTENWYSINCHKLFIL